MNIIKRILSRFKRKPIVSSDLVPPEYEAKAFPELREQYRYIQPDEFAPLSFDECERRGIFDVRVNVERVVANSKCILDGQEVKMCFRCCPKEGWADVYAPSRDNPNTPFITAAGTVAKKRLTGAVEFRFDPPTQ